MSSYYTTAQLEEMRRARLRQELEDNLRQMKERLRERLEAPAESRVERTTAEKIVLTAVDRDAGTSGYRIDSEIGAGESGTVPAEARREVDLSALLDWDAERAQRAEGPFDKLLAQVEERAVLTEEDRRARERIVSELKALAARSGENEEDRLAEASWRLKIYLRAGTPAAQVDRAAAEERLLEYRALCRLAEAVPTASMPGEVEKECARLTALLEKRRQDAYIMDTLTELMGELGCSVVGETVLDHTEGQLFSVDGHPLCDVFMGADASGILFEPVAESREGSLDRRRQIERSANSICAMYGELEALAAQRGIILRRVYQDPAELEKLYVRGDVRTEKGRQRRRQAREKAVGTEE